jgi:hypothetical protein
MPEQLQMRALSKFSAQRPGIKPQRLSIKSLRFTSDECLAAIELWVTMRRLAETLTVGDAAGWQDAYALKPAAYSFEIRCVRLK